MLMSLRGLRVKGGEIDYYAPFSKLDSTKMSDGNSTLTGGDASFSLVSTTYKMLSQRSWVQIPYRPEFFLGLLFTTT